MIQKIGMFILVTFALISSDQAARDERVRSSSRSATCSARSLRRSPTCSTRSDRAADGGAAQLDPTQPAGPRRRGSHLPRPWARRATGFAAGQAGEVLYRERHHPIWFLARSWVWLLGFVIALPMTVRAEAGRGQLVGGVLVLVSELGILLRLIDWTTTLVVIRPAGLQVVGYEGNSTRWTCAWPRPASSRAGWVALGYAHLAVRRPGVRPRTTSQMFLARPDELRAALDAALSATNGS